MLQLISNLTTAEDCVDEFSTDDEEEGRAQRGVCNSSTLCEPIAQCVEYRPTQVHIEMKEDHFLEHHMTSNISDLIPSCIDDSSIYITSDSVFNPNGFSVGDSVFNFSESAVNISDSVYNNTEAIDTVYNSSGSDASSSGTDHRGNNRDRDDCNGIRSENGMTHEGSLYSHSQQQLHSNIQLNGDTLSHISISTDMNLMSRKGIEDIEEMIENSEDVGDDGDECGNEDCLAATDRENRNEIDTTLKVSKKRSRNDNSSSSSRNIGSKKVMFPSHVYISHHFFQHD